jgi:hypothetical protein
MKLPYGGIEPDAADPLDDPWASLHAIQRQLESAEPVSPTLARWLGEAIRSSDNDPAALLRGLGLLKPRCRPSPYPRGVPEWCGKRVAEEGARGLSPERAVNAVLDQISENGWLDPQPDRETIRRWAKKYADDNAAYQKEQDKLRHDYEE